MVHRLQMLQMQIKKGPLTQVRGPWFILVSLVCGSIHPRSWIRIVSLNS